MCAQYHGYIPLDRHTELVATIPDEAIYSIAIPSTELEVGDHYLSVQCGAKANTFRGVMFEVRGLLSGPGDAVHGEVCPREWIYHRIDMTGAAAGAKASSAHRQLAASGAPMSVADLEGKHVELRLKKHTGDFSFLTLHADHPPTRLMPP